VHQTWRTPASSSTRSPATSWAPRVGRCWPPWLAGSVICRCWPGWPVAGCPACCPVAPSAAGPVRGPHARLVRLARAHLEHLEGAIAARDRRVDEVITRFARARDRLDTITGVGKRAAETIIAEIGADMSVFLPPPTWPPGRAAARATTAPAARAARASRPGQPLAGGADRVPLGGGPEPRHRPVGPGLAAGPADRQQEGRGRCWALDPGHRLVPAHRRRRRPGPWGDDFVRRDTERQRQWASPSSRPSATASSLNPWPPNTPGIHISG
jgi:hypothetical protein